MKLHYEEAQLRDGIKATRLFVFVWESSVFPGKLLGAGMRTQHWTFGVSRCVQSELIKFSAWKGRRTAAATCRPPFLCLWRERWCWILERYVSSPGLRPRKYKLWQLKLSREYFYSLPDDWIVGSIKTFYSYTLGAFHKDIAFTAIYIYTYIHIY